MPDRERNETSARDLIERIVQFANEHAFDADAVDLSRCYSKRRRDKDRESYKTYEFLTVNRIMDTDLRNVLAELSIDQYAYTSIKPGYLDAYVFGVHMPEIVWDNPEIYLKFQISDGFIIITIHESERPLTFPYKEE